MNIKIIYSKKHLEHDPKFEIYDGVYEPYAEKAERMTSLVEALHRNGMKVYPPNHFSMEHINRVHKREYVSFLQQRSQGLSKNSILYPSYFIMDTYTPIVAKTYDAARSSVDVALTGAKSVLEGERIVYSLCRPPGHHADCNSMGGYCYFNNAAIAAEYLSRHGKVAILDIDFHHGNGTQSVFYDRADVLYVSIHANPEVKFPYSSGFSEEVGRGEGLGFNKNYPLPLGTTNEEYMEVLQRALQDVRNFTPNFLVISAGFDTYEKDPIGGFKLTIPFYRNISQQIAALNLPTLIIQEGGYNIDALGDIAYSFLQGIA